MEEWFATGRYVVFWVQDGRGGCPAKEFLDKAKRESAKVARDVAHIEATVRRFASEGHVANPTKFKRLGEKEVEFKAFQLRLFGIIDDQDRILLTHAIKKKKKRIQNLVKTINNKLSQDPDFE